MIKEFFLNIKEIIHSKHPFIELIKDIYELLSDIWSYHIFTTADKHKVLISNVALGIIFFLIGIKIAQHLRGKIAKRFSHTLDKNTSNTFSRVIYYIMIILIFIFVLDIANMPLTAFTVIGTTFAIGLGLGSQHISNNFMSGIIIMIEKPIKIGDIIEVDNIVGRVTNIGARCISITTEEKIDMLIPNTSILQNSIINWTLENSIVKIGTFLTISNNIDIEKFDKIIMETIQMQGNILDTPEPETLLQEISKDSYKIELNFCIDINLTSRKQVINTLNRDLVNIFKEHNIEVIHETGIKYTKTSL
jgi:potassium-dependent mechanosensitive channel